VTLRTILVISGVIFCIKTDTRQKFKYYWFWLLYKRIVNPNRKRNIPFFLGLSTLTHNSVSKTTLKTNSLDLLFWIFWCTEQQHTFNISHSKSQEHELSAHILFKCLPNRKRNIPFFLGLSTLSTLYFCPESCKEKNALNDIRTIDTDLCSFNMTVRLFGVRGRDDFNLLIARAQLVLFRKAFKSKESFSDFSSIALCFSFFSLFLFCIGSL
jgi:hypothetical protein